MLSTPSFGITESRSKPSSSLRLPSFNSLFRDHTFEAGYDLGLQALLSTPSFGITEPDSGIFRLSAAFCRGTSSHK